MDRRNCSFSWTQGAADGAANQDESRKSEHDSRCAITVATTLSAAARASRALHDRQVFHQKLGHMTRHDPLCRWISTLPSERSRTPERPARSAERGGLCARSRPALPCRRLRLRYLPRPHHVRIIRYFILLNRICLIKSPWRLLTPLVGQVRLVTPP